MSLAAIRTAMRTVVAGMSGVEACYPRIPETKPPVDVFAVIETPNGIFAPHGTDLERREHLINVYFLVPRNSDLWAEQVAFEPYIDAFPDAMASAFTLGGLTYGTRYSDPSYEIVVAEIKDQSYIGPRFGTLHKQKMAVTYSG